MSLRGRRLSNPFLNSLSTLLVLFYAFLLNAIANPQVSSSYRAYYIDRSCVYAIGERAFLKRIESGMDADLPPLLAGTRVSPGDSRTARWLAWGDRLQIVENEGKIIFVPSGTFVGRLKLIAGNRNWRDALPITVRLNGAAIFQGEFGAAENEWTLSFDPALLIPNTANALTFTLGERHWLAGGTLALESAIIE